ncbi:MAG: PQQ-binding-like beta-propeller repeat protein [Verrucomicrobiota bacterium]
MTIRLLLALWFSTGLLSASDWPQIFGPNRNGVYAGQDLAAAWPKEGPRRVWQVKVGEGFSGPAVAQGKVIVFHRLGDREVVQCLDAKTGNALWKFDYETKYRDQFGFDNGPRAVPAIAGGKVYTLGAEGTLSCVNLADGKLQWRVNTKEEFKAPAGWFGMVCSPLVEGNAVVVNIGGEGAGIVAFHKDTGKVLWKATDDPASYSSPIAATINDRRLLVFFAFNGLLTLEPAGGKVVHSFEWKPPIRESVSAATPIVVDDLIFISASYNTGAVLLRAKGERVEKVWSGDESMSNHYATCVYRDGFLYGLDGRHDFAGGTELRCVEFRTGKVRWSKPGLSAANVMLAGDQLLALTENGELIRVAAQSNAYKETGRAQILSAGVRAFPALADGRFYARSKNVLVCINLGQ